MFSGSKIAHLNFVGDSILGNGANMEAGAMIANYRNELSVKQIHVMYQQQKTPTHVEKFGAMVGDGTKIGANSVLAPGTVLPGNTVVRRGEVIDQIEAVEL